MNTLVLTPALDNRHGVGKVTSRIGLETDAKAFTPEHDLLNLISTAHANNALHCVLVDEAQFLTREQVYQLGEVTALWIHFSDRWYQLFPYTDFPLLNTRFDKNLHN